MENIERTNPNSATITINNTTTITAKVEQSDNDKGSGVDIENEKCKWICTSSDSEIGTDETKYTGGTFTTNPQTITLNYQEKGTYYLHILTVDKAGNKKETISEPIFPAVTNAPNIDGFNKETTYYSAWDLNTEGTEYVLKEKKMSENTVPNNWYDYTEGVNHWANVKTIGGGNECYWVWIPRYAYKVPTKGSTAEKIEIKFLDGITNIPIGEKEAITNTTATPGTWVVHPAFTNVGNGGLGELTGIWVAKYEASSSSVSTITLENGILTGDIASLEGTGGGTDTNLKINVKPNVTSWRKIDVNSIFTVCKNLVNSDNSLCTENNAKNTKLDSHMMKNTEWGAVAYLSSSKYGKTDMNGNRKAVYDNPYSKDETNFGTITGLAGKAVQQININITSDLYVYNTPQGCEASTTGNVYGIYDMVGGAWETTAAIYKGSSSDNLGNNDKRSKLWEEANSKYVDQYTETTGLQEEYYGNITKYGDAVYETSSCGGTWRGVWDYAVGFIPDSTSPMFVRGGRASNNNSRYMLFLQRLG